MSTCRICDSGKIAYVTYLRPYLDYEGFEVYDCMDCGSRFVFRKRDVFAEMHTIQNSPYSSHREIARRSKKYFDTGQLGSLKRFLSKTPKFRFVIDNVAPANKDVKILELGCSVGYLAASFILGGYDILGCDISQAAIKSACSYFGNHFIVLDRDFYERHRNSFDYVYHLGTIGCVDRPIGFTEKALSLLKPRGTLLFNAPSVKAVKEMGVVWNSTPPPDLITMYDEGFWHRFNVIANVNITYKPYDHYNNAIRHTNLFLYRSALDPRPKFFYDKKSSLSTGRGQLNVQTLSRLPHKLVVRLFYYLSKNGLIHHYPSESGMFVTLCKNGGGKRLKQ